MIRHLTGDPPDLARRATELLSSGRRLLLPDLIVAEALFVLESFYELDRPRLVALIRSALAHPSLRVIDLPTLLRSLEIYEVHRIDYAEAYLVAQAEATGVGVVASFDRSIDRVKTVRRIESA